MKSVIALSVLAAAVAAQSLPACYNECLGKDAVSKSTTCTVTPPESYDAPCVCKDDTYQEALFSCLMDTCNPDNPSEFKNAMNHIEQLCQMAPVAPSGTTACISGAPTATADPVPEATPTAQEDTDASDDASIAGDADADEPSDSATSAPVATATPTILVRTTAQPSFTSVVIKAISTGSSTSATRASVVPAATTSAKSSAQSVKVQTGAVGALVLAALALAV